MSDTDVRVQDEGTIVLFYGVSERGERWLEESLEGALRFGSAYVAEHRFAPAIVEGLLFDCLNVAGGR
jgi:hypothetical protein